METSPDTDAVFAALAQAQAVISDPVKNKKNPHFRSSYTSLDGALPVIREAFETAGLAFVQGATVIDGKPWLTTRLCHKSGQWVESVYPLAYDNNPQKMASGYTYARRNALFGMVGIAPSDDDGNAAAKPTPRAKPKPTPDGAAGVVERWTENERKRFCGDLTRMQWKYEDVAAFCESVGKPRPSAMTPKQRADLITYVKDGPTALLDFIESRGA